MPSISRSQQRLMGAALHGATFPKAKKLRMSMSLPQLHDFASGSEAGKPDHVPVKGDSKDVIHSNTQVFKNTGMSEFDATKTALKHASRHKNLGKYLHPKKSK